MNNENREQLVLFLCAINSQSVDLESLQIDSSCNIVSSSTVRYYTQSNAHVGAINNEKESNRIDLHGEVDVTFSYRWLSTDW